MNTNERYILTTTCFGHFMSHFNMLVFPALVLPLAGLYGIELAQVLILSFWMYLLFGLTALPWGILSDRFGAKPFLLLFFAGAGVCGIGAAYSIHSPVVFSLFLAGIGLFSGIYHPAGLGLISKGIQRMSMALGYNGVAGNAGLAAAPLMAGVINYFFGVKAVFLCVGFLNLSGALIMMMLSFDEPPKQSGTATRDSGRLIWGFIILCVCMMLGGVAYRGVTVILPSYFELTNPALLDALGRLISLPGSRNVAATILSSLVFVVGMLGQYAGGIVAERSEPRKAYLVFHLIALPLAFCIAYTTGVSMLLVTMGYMLFLLGMQPIENTLVARFTPDKVRHSAYGAKFVLTFGIGAVAVHMVGWIKQTWSLPAVFIAMGLISVAIVFSISLLILFTRSISMAK